jgi:hypothetical protein
MLRIRSFDDVSAIIFIASLSEYDLVLAEDRYTLYFQSAKLLLRLLKFFI